MTTTQESRWSRLVADEAALKAVVDAYLAKVMEAAESAVTALIQKIADDPAEDELAVDDLHAHVMDAVEDLEPDALQDMEDLLDELTSGEWVPYAG